MNQLASRTRRLARGRSVRLPDVAAGTHDHHEYEQNQDLTAPRAKRDPGSFVFLFEHAGGCRADPAFKKYFFSLHALTSGEQFGSPLCREFFRKLEALGIAVALS